MEKQTHQTAEIRHPAFVGPDGKQSGTTGSSFVICSTRTARLVAVFIGGMLILYLLHACAILPTHPSAARSFVMPRDRYVMKRLFKLQELPASFNIERVKHRGISMIPSPDGPPPIAYAASVSGGDYNALTRNIKQDRVPWKEFRNRGKLPLEFDAGFKSYVDDNSYHWSEVVSAAPGAGTYETTSTMRRTWDSATILVDERSTNTIRLFITTYLPYDE